MAYLASSIVEHQARGSVGAPMELIWYFPWVLIPAFWAMSTIRWLIAGSLFIFRRAPSLNAWSDPPIIAACCEASIRAIRGVCPLLTHMR
jgi:hypothetical protein